MRVAVAAPGSGKPPGMKAALAMRSLVCLSAPRSRPHVSVRDGKSKSLLRQGLIIQDLRVRGAFSAPGLSKRQKWLCSGPG